MQRIIYQNDAGGVAIVIPADCGLTMQQIAELSVPAGKPYKIIDAADVPSDRSQRDLWAVDAAILTDGVGA